MEIDGIKISGQLDSNWTLKTFVETYKDLLPFKFMDEKRKAKELKKAFKELGGIEK